MSLLHFSWSVLIALALIQPLKADAPQNIYSPPGDCGSFCAGITFNGCGCFPSMTTKHYGPRFRTFQESIPEFWNLVSKKSDTECWEWLGCKHDEGYGRFRSDGKFISAHKFSYALHFGDIPEGLCVCHKCDNPPCCNPNHFFLGTKKDNSNDRDVKGRNVNKRGEENGSSKLKEQQVLEIRASYIPFKCTVRKLASTYNVSAATIKLVIARKRWSHI